MKVVWLIRALMISVATVLVLWGFAWWWLLILAAAYMGLMAWFSFHPNTQVFSSCYFRHDSTEVSLTFDDGPHPESTPQLLALLAQYQIKATFFLVGERAAAHPELVRQIADQGHEIGNHSHTHSYVISMFSKHRWLNELADCQQILSAILGNSPKIFRPPYGVSTPNTAYAAAEHSLQQIGWSCHTQDFFGSVARITDCLNELKEGDIVLLHETKTNTVAALTRWLQTDQAKSFVFTTVTDGANLAANHAE